MISGYKLIMMENETPRTRSLLRQAARNVEGGKIVAAEQLYRQIIEENPDSEAAWLGLAEVVQDEEQKEEAYGCVLELNANNKEAQYGLAVLHGEVSPGEELGTDQTNLEDQAAVDQSGKESPAEAVNAKVNVNENREEKSHHHDSGPTVTVDSELEFYCYRHTNRSTSLRCYKCNKPICSECTVKTPVGYLCPDCHKEAEDAFFNAKPTDYLLSLLVALPVSLMAGWIVVRFSGGFFMILLFIFAGGAVGGFIARLSKRVIGNRRGRYIPHLIAGSIIGGVLWFAWPYILSLLAGNTGLLLSLVGMGVYLFTAASSAFYWAR